MNHAAHFVRGGDGRVLAQVPLANHDRAVVLDKADYDRALAALGDTAWRLVEVNGRAYVRAQDPRSGNPVTVARLLLDEPQRAGIRYANGDPLDLRRSNLVITFGGGGVRKKPKLGSPRSAHAHSARK